MEKIAEFLKSTMLFGPLSVKDIEKHIVDKGTITTYQKGSHIITPHEKVDTIKVLLSGKVNIVYYYADGSYSLSTTETLRRVFALDLVATKTGISPYFAIATEKSTVFSLPAKIILKKNHIPEEIRQPLMEEYLIMLSNLHLQKEKHLMILSRNGLRDRITTYLSLQSQLRNSLSFSIPFSREEMAAYLCVNRSALSHELSLMKNEGLIDFHKNNFTILKYEQIEKVQ